MGRPPTDTRDARRELETRTARLYGEIHVLIPPETIALYRRLLSPEHLEVAPDFFAGARCLDAGFGGTGRALFSMVLQGAERAVGVDLSLDNARNARAQNAAVSDRASLAVASLLALPFRDGSFDFVHCNGVLHHLRDPGAGFRELARALRDGGALYVSVYGRGGLLTWLALAGRGLAHLFPRPWMRRLLESGLRLDGLLVSNILDVLYVPIQHRLKEVEVRQWFREGGLAAVRRLRNPTWLFQGFLQRLLHASAWHHDSLLGRLLHGEGWIIMIGRRPSSVGAPRARGRQR